LTQDTTDPGLCTVGEFGVMCVPPKTKKQERNSSVENVTKGCVLPLILRYHTKLHFLGSANTQVENQNTRISKYYHYNY